MLESMTILNKGGLILYQYTASPTLLDKDNNQHGNGGGPRFTQHVLQKYWFPLLLNPATPPDKTYSIHNGITFCWQRIPSDLIAVCVYPDILFEGPRQYLQQWAQGLLQKTCAEYQQYYQAAVQQAEQDDVDLILPETKPFDKVFRILLEQSKHQKQQQQPAAAASASAAPSQSTDTDATNNNKSNNNNKPSKGKEKRQWHDGKAKVTQEAMDELDKSKAETPEEKAQAQERALQEARAAYLPTEQDLQEQQTSGQNDPSNSTLANLFAHMTGTKVLTDADLDGPLQQMQDLLTSKNVAEPIAKELCQGVRAKLRQKKLTHLARVQTAVRQALEATLSHLLRRHPVDLLHNVVSKRGGASDFSLFGSSKPAPYVIVVIGINGVGKSTSLAKLAFYLKQNGCSPLLVAGDTFRSGAVEQLSVHAQCLDVPIFAQGYAKDPSAVAQAAIQQATNNGNDVVLIDTAGRMQNNAPLMKALGKLVQENNPDFILLVCEALVGHDGLDQFQMFQRALGHKRKLDGLLLTKFDTVGEKVGAALTLTHETGAPIVFCGTGQKYHHLQKLEASAVIQALFS